MKTKMFIFGKGIILEKIDKEEIVRLTEEHGGQWGINHARRLLHLISIIGKGQKYDAEAVWERLLITFEKETFGYFCVVESQYPMAQFKINDPATGSDQPVSQDTKKMGDSRPLAAALLR